MTDVLSIVAILGLASPVYAQPMQPNTATLARQLGSGFESKFADVNGTRLHYVRGGNGPAIILLHGFPEDWYEFRLVMPRLAKMFTVVAPDLRGVGESAPSETGYEASNLAEDVHQLIVNLGLEQVYVFGHDIGGLVAYAFARPHPESARGVMILDVAFPGLDPWQDILGGQFPERKRPSGRRQRLPSSPIILISVGTKVVTTQHVSIRKSGTEAKRVAAPWLQSS